MLNHWISCVVAISLLIASPNPLAQAQQSQQRDTSHGDRLVEEYFPPSGRVADIGGGPGRYAIELLRLGFRVTLFDLSEGTVSFARARLDGGSLVPCQGPR